MQNKRWFEGWSTLGLCIRIAGWEGDAGLIIASLWEERGSLRASKQVYVLFDRSML